MSLLREQFLKKVTLSDEAWQDIESGLKQRHLQRKELYLKQGHVCREIGFIAKGCVRLFYNKDGIDITKDFNFENSFCGSWASFSLAEPSRFNIVAMEDTELFTFSRQQLYSWFETYPALEKMGRLNMEQMFIRKELREASFLLDSAEERYRRMIEQQPELFQRVPQKYIASYLGLSAETLSRLRRRKMFGGHVGI